MKRHLFAITAVLTALFSVYIHQQHFRVAKFLPTRNALREDLRRVDDDISFLQGAYLQPELRAPRRVGPGVEEERPAPASDEGYQQLH